MRKIVIITILSLNAIAAWSQTIIKGKITDFGTGQSLTDAVISTGKKGINTSTDNQGNFELHIPKYADTLYISYIGYVSQAIPVKQQARPLRITLERDKAVREALGNEKAEAVFRKRGANRF